MYIMTVLICARSVDAVSSGCWSELFLLKDVQVIDTNTLNLLQLETCCKLGFNYISHQSVFKVDFPTNGWSARKRASCRSFTQKQLSLKFLP